MKPRVIERKAYWLVAASLLEYGLIGDWVVDGRDTVELPFYSYSGPYRVWSFESTPSLGMGSWILKFSIDGSGLLYVNDSVYSGLDNAHTYVLVQGPVKRVRVEATPPTIHGVHNWSIRFNYSLYARVAVEGFITGLKLLALYDYVSSLRDQEIKDDIMNLASDILGNTEIKATHGQLAVAGMILYDSYWSPWTPRKELPPPRFDVYIIRGLMGEGALLGVISDRPVYTEEDISSLASNIWSRLEKGLLSLKRRYRDEGVIYAVGHSHMDSAWLWPIEEAKRKVIRTNATVAYLSRLKDSMTYIQSPAIHHHWLGENAEVLEAVGSLAKSGRWIPVGGMWVEGELQIVDGESIARQLLYGQRYYRREFDRETTIGWLPDNFGYPASLPQLLLDAGIRILFIQKVLWNDTTSFPHHLFLWEGIDGSTIPVQVIPDNVYAYNNPARPGHIKEYWSNYNGRVKHVIYPYGYGDGGGGPTLEMAIGVDVAKILPGLPTIVEGELEKLEASILGSTKLLPRVRGELYLELHRGSYTTNSTIKSLVSRAESLLRSLDILESIMAVKGMEYKGVEEHWKTLLLAEFHDILPGTGIKEVYDDAENALNKVIGYAEKRIKDVLQGVLDKSNACGLLVYNDAPWTRSGVIQVDARIDGCQAFEKSCLVYVESIPPLGYALIKTGRGSGANARVYTENDKLVLDNGIVKAIIGKTGLLESLTAYGEEYVAEPSNRILAHIDEPAEWDAWDIEKESLVHYRELNLIEAPSASATGPLRACVSYKVGKGNSWIRQDVCVDKGSPTLDYYTRVSWKEKQVILKAWFAPAISNPRYYFEIPFGYIERRREELEGPKFESPMLRWASIQGEGKGLAIISASKHGIGYLNGRIGLSLLKKPVFPNPWTDEGFVEFSYSLYPYKGWLEDAGVSRVAFDRWSPLKAVYRDCVENKGRRTTLAYTLLDIEPRDRIHLSTVKVSEDGDGIIIRLYNPSKQEIDAIISIPETAVKVEEVNVTEINVHRRLSVVDGRVRVRLQPFKLSTIKVYLS